MSFAWSIFFGSTEVNQMIDLIPMIDFQYNQISRSDWYPLIRIPIYDVNMVEAWHETSNNSKIVVNSCQKKCTLTIQQRYRFSPSAGKIMANLFPSFVNTGGWSNSNQPFGSVITSESLQSGIRLATSHTDTNE